MIMVEVINIMKNQNHITLTITKENRAYFQRLANVQGLSLSQFLSRSVSCIADIQSGLIHQEPVKLSNGKIVYRWFTADHQPTTIVF